MHLTKRFLQLFNPTDKRKEHFARKLVGFSMIQMYNVVADVKNYYKFVPFCKKSTILFEEPKLLRANLEIGFPPIFENYTSVVTFCKPKTVRAVCTDGILFSLLETNWKFTSGLKNNPQSCIVDFHINFEFKSAVYSQIATIFFNQLVDQMENAFLEEVQRRYGKPTLPLYKLNSDIENS